MCAEVLPKEQINNLNGFRQESLPNGFRSEEANEMLSKPPSWLLKWGNLSILLIVFIIFAISIFIKYPDVLECKTTIIEVPMPQKIFSSKSAKLGNIFFSDGENVRKGEVVAEYQNEIGYYRIKLLESLLDNYKSNNASDSNKILIMNLLRQFNGKDVGGSLSKERVFTIEENIKNWKNNYALISPDDGKINYLFPSVNDYKFRQNEEMFMISSNKFKYLASIDIPFALTSQIKEGQKAMISIDGFSGSDIGEVEGNIQQINRYSIQQNEQMICKAYITLPMGVYTNRHVLLPKLPSMQGSARILIKNRSIFDRMISNIRHK